MSLAGSRLGPYDIVALLGAGGMGEVYRARDTKLGREVAIKILPQAFAADADRLARFEREARVLASLNHPHIAQIYGVEESGGMTALVLEFVEGETLAARIARLKGSRAFGVQEALAIARQIADALDVAHERGIVHRDLKPANIVITPDGTVKVLDFGLAKGQDAGHGLSRAAGDGAGTAEAVPYTNSPTVMGPTVAGVLLGTAPYMSPEQARGKTVDKRTDIWAFGCVLFEMLTGRRAFDGDTTSDTIAAILEREPDWSGLLPETPSYIRRLLQRCLEKDRKRRLRDIGDAYAAFDAPAIDAPSQERARSTRRQSLIAAGVLIVASLTTLAVLNRRVPSAALLRLSVHVPGQLSPQLSATISPDGRRLAFVSTDAAGKSMLWVRPLDAQDAQPLAGTENAAHPAWSPDGSAIAFVAEAKVKTVAADGGPVRTLAAAALNRMGLSWSRDGILLFKASPAGLATVPATGGTVTAVSFSNPNVQNTASWPFFLPDGHHFLFFAAGPQADDRGVYVGSLESDAATLLVRSEVKGAYATAGYLFFVRGESLFAQPFDASRLTLSGRPTAVSDGVWTASSARQASFSVSDTVVAHVNASLYNNQLVWFDRSGRPLGSEGAPDRYLMSVPAISPDGARIAVARGNRGIWLLDIGRGTAARATFITGDDDSPHWSIDGKRLVFRAGGAGGRIFRREIGTGSDELLYEVGSRLLSLDDYSRDERFVIYTVSDGGHSDIWVLRLDGDRRPAPFLQSPFNKTQAQVSPDGRWIAYTANESGDDQVYVERFPAGGGKRQVSAAGGVQPRWRADGTELFYLGADQQMMVVRVLAGATTEFGPATALFRTKLVPQGSQSMGLPTKYDVSGDGQRFLLVAPPDDPGPPITVVVNWGAVLR